MLWISERVMSIIHRSGLRTPSLCVCERGSGGKHWLIGRLERNPETTICVQGPPGAGKTYTGSRVFLALLKDGHKVGVTSNSHKAIENLMEGILEAAKADKFTVQTKVYLNCIKRTVEALKANAVRNSCEVRRRLFSVVHTVESGPFCRKNVGKK